MRSGAIGIPPMAGNSVNDRRLKATVQELFSAKEAAEMLADLVLAIA